METQFPGSATTVQNDFLFRHVPRFGKRVFRLGLSATFGLPPKDIQEALLGPINYYFFWHHPFNKKAMQALREVVKQDRDRLVLATGPFFGYFAGSLRRAAEKTLRFLRTDYLDVFQVFWAGKMAFLSNSVVDELLKLREEGKVRAIGTSIHDRKRAGKLAASSDLDVLMVRYNAAHPGAEADIFPHLQPRRPAVVGYTATDWRRLLKAPKGWQGPPASAGDCYRFVLSNPAVDVVLTGPKTQAELRDTLQALDKGPLAPDEMDRLRTLGKAVHG